MYEKKIKAPFFIVNPKSFLYGKDLLELARYANKLAKEYKVNVLFTGPMTELSMLVKECPNLMITAQHMDSVSCGDSMGKIFAESLKSIGVQVVVLNHADYPMSISTLTKTIQRANEVGLQTIVCADSVQEAEAITFLKPDVILAEPTRLIGKEQISSREYVTSTVKRIKALNPNILVEQGAGIRTAKDIEELLQLGADGVGVTSGIIKANKTKKAMKEMIEMVARYK